ncbi:retrovirus-related Pol polyprotein from transposon 297 [Trichonephila clavipes]|nr:retrovirus-related Pol polyprotein from transposon 297 [Trichonephila clavipes]
MQEQDTEEESKEPVQSEDRMTCCMKGNTRNRWRDGPVCPAADKELWRLGPDSSAVRSAGCKCLPFLLVKSAREVPAFRFFPEKDKEEVSSVFTCNVKCIMAFLLRERKDVLLEVAKELRVEIDITLPKIEFKKRICQSKYYDEESVKCLLEGILEEEREKQEIKEYEERRLARERELERLRIQLRNKLNENKLKAGIGLTIFKCLYFVRKSYYRMRCTNVSHPSEVGRKEFNVNRSSDCDVKMKVGVCEGRVKTVAMGAQRVIIPDNIVEASFELKRDKGVANPEGLICENSCEEKYTLGTLRGCGKQLTVNRESFRIHTIAKIAGPLKGKEDTCKADGLTCLEDGEGEDDSFIIPAFEGEGGKSLANVNGIEFKEEQRKCPDLKPLWDKAQTGIDKEFRVIRGKLVRVAKTKRGRRDVEEFVKTCDSCQRVGKPRDKAKAPLKLVPIISEVFSKINIDAVGPLPVSTKQNRYLITSICVASKYPEAIPVESITSPNVIDALLSIFSRIGFPREIQSDLGTSFTSELTTTFFNKFGIKVTRSSVSHPKATQWSECIEPSSA